MIEPSKEIQEACREYIDSIKNEPWYQVDYDDIILEAFAEGVSRVRLHWKDVDTIIRLYDRIDEQCAEEEDIWESEEDNTGIPYPYHKTRADICSMVARSFNKSKDQ